MLYNLGAQTLWGLPGTLFFGGGPFWATLFGGALWPRMLGGPLGPSALLLCSCRAEVAAVGAAPRAARAVGWERVQTTAWGGGGEGDAKIATLQWAQGCGGIAFRYMCKQGAGERWVCGGGPGPKCHGGMGLKPLGVGWRRGGDLHRIGSHCLAAADQRVSSTRPSCS